MNAHVTQLIFTESGGFTGLQRGCTLPPDALPEAPRGQLQSLLMQPQQANAQAPAVAMPDMQLYTLELLTQPENAPATGQTSVQASAAADANAADSAAQHRVLYYPADEVPDDVADLIGFLRERAQPM
jgi:hypothetical protein